MAESPQIPALYVTFDDVRRWKEDNQQIERQIAELQARYESNKRRLDALAVLSPAALQGIPRNEESPEAHGAFTRAVMQLLETATEGLTLAQGRELLAQTPFADRAERNPNVVYNVFTRMMTKGKAAKRGQRYFAKEHLDALLNKFGADWPGFEETDDTTTSGPSFVREYLRKNIRAPSRELVEMMRRQPALADKVSANLQYPYSVISRMAYKKELVKEGKFYRLRSQRNEPPSGRPQGGSEAGSSDGSRSSMELFPKPRVVSGA